MFNRSDPKQQVDGSDSQASAAAETPLVAEAPILAEAPVPVAEVVPNEQSPPPTQRPTRTRPALKRIVLALAIALLVANTAGFGYLVHRQQEDGKRI